MRPLLYLEFRQAINSIKNTARSPKRLIPALLLGCWFLCAVMQSAVLMSGAPRPPRADLMLLAHVPEAQIELGLFLLLSIGSILVMYNGFNSGLMIFSVAHIDFMFPTPISRRSVLLVKLIKDYGKYSLYIILAYVILGSIMFTPLKVSTFPLGLVGIAAVLALLVLVVNISHTINIVFTFGYERLKQSGLFIRALLIAAPACVVLAAVYQYITTGDSYLSLMWAGNSPVVNIVFAPASWCAGLVLSPLKGVLSDDWLHLILLWLLAGGSMVLLMSRKENVYEPSLGISVKYARTRMAMRSGDYTDIRLEALRKKGNMRANGFSMQPFGRGAVAFVWKNLLLRYRVSRGQLLFMLIAPLVIVYMVSHFIDDSDVLKYLPLLLLYMMGLLSLTLQAEVRADLRHANIIKSTPVAAWKVMLAQTVSGVIYLSVGIVVFAVYMWALVPQTRGEMLLACLIGAPFLGFCTLPAMIIPSLLYPDTRDMMQNHFCGVVGFLLTALAAAPTVVLGAFFWFVIKIPVYTILTVICAANVIIGAAGISIAGAMFRKFDPTSE